MTDSGIDGIGFLDRMNPTWAVQSLFVETNFESRSHEDMIGMVKVSDPDTTRRLGQKLADAARDMDAIAQALSTRAPRVDWEGQGARAFTDWNQSMVNSTRRLAEFSRSSGEAMKNAADTLQEVKRDMPPYPDSARLTLNGYIMQNPGGMAKLDRAAYLKDSSSSGGPTATEAYDAKQQLEAGHGEAVRQMRKLSTSYSLADTTMKTAQRPTFPPMPGQLMPEKSTRVVDDRHLGASPRPTVTPSGREAGPAAQAGGVVDANETPATGRVAPTENPRMTLDGGVVLPDAPPAPAQQHANPSPSPSGLGGPSGPVGGPAGPGVPRQSTQRVVGQANQSPVPKSGMRTPAIGTVGQTGTPTSRGSARLPGDHGNGIHGGRQTSGGAGQPTHGLPRGGVAGAEPAQNQHARPPMGGRPMAGGTGGAGGGAASSGVVGGRPLATTPGGRVGTPSSNGITGGRPFTPGGSGLVRGGSESSGHGAMGRPPTSSASPGEERRQDGRRPDYLVEDEETWQTNNGARISPPVVE